MNFLELAQNRYTTKKYDASKTIASDKLEQLKEIMRLCPSSIDSQPWKFTFITDTSLKEKLSKVSLFNEHKVQDASCLVVFSALDNVSYFEKNILCTLPEGSQMYFKNMQTQITEEQVKVWFKNQVYLSLGYFLSACAAMRIDSTPMEGIDVKAYAEIFKDDNFKPVFAATIGYRASNDDNQVSVTPKSRLSLDKVVESK